MWALLVAILGSAAAERARRASFMVIGDWGWDAQAHGDVRSRTCQSLIAQKMDQTFRQLGDVKFVINVGDSFYPTGVSSKNDPQWDIKWRQVYSERVRSIPWYSVYGNHDLMADKAACSHDEMEAAQINYDVQNLDYFVMPGYSWYIEDTDLDMEILALDFNDLWLHQTCPHSTCKEACEKIIPERTQAGFQLFYDRMAESNASNMLIFSHYPTDYFWPYPELLGNLSSATRPGGLERHVEFFGGHRHNVDKTSPTSIAPSVSWLVGGGGGWSCDGREQGFVVGEIYDDGSIETRAVLVNYHACCCTQWWCR